MSRTSKTSRDRRNEFVQAARDLFNEKGFENTSVDDMVARVGVAKGLFYYYFDSKEEVLEILYERLQDEIGSAIAGAMEKKGLDAIERLTELIMAKRDVALRSSALMAYFKNERNKALRLSMEKRSIALMTDAMEEIVRQGVDEGVFHTDHPRQTAVAIISTIHGLSVDLPEMRSREAMQEYYRTVQAISERILGMRPGTLVVSERLLPPEYRMD